MIKQQTGYHHRLLTFGRWVSLLLIVLVLFALTAWCALAIYFGDSHTSLLQTLLASAFALAGFVTLLSIWIKHRFRQFLVAYIVLFTIVLSWWFNIAPSNDRAWQTDVAQLPYATINGDLVTVHNIRNFTYRSETDYTPAYVTRTYDLSKLKHVDLFAVYWMGPAIAHTIISFGFGDQNYLAISIEARKEQGEGYSSVKGFFRQYELFYVVADERDVIRLRTNYRNNPPEDVYRYRLKVSPDNARRFFLDYINTINEVKARPRFYNTLTANCTNVIWMHARVNQERVAFSWKLLASGYAPEYLYDMGRLDTSIPFAELTRTGYINSIARGLDDVPNFAARIRASRTTSNATLP